MGMSKCPGVHESLVLGRLWTEASNSLQLCGIRGYGYVCNLQGGGMAK